MAENETHLIVEAELPNFVKERLIKLLDEEEYRGIQGETIGPVRGAADSLLEPSR